MEEEERVFEGARVVIFFVARSNSLKVLSYMCFKYGEQNNMHCQKISGVIIR